jgi:hypothetical protein
VDDLLRLQIEPLARGGQNLHVGCGGQQFTQPADVVEQVFQVVEDEQQLALAQVADHLALQLAGAGGNLERGSQRGGQRFRLAGIGCGQRRKPDAVEKGWGERGGGFQRQAALAGAARPHDREQAAGRVGELLAHESHLRGAPDETGERGRQIVARSMQRGADAGVECGRLFGWFGVEGGAHHAAALLILGERRRVLAGARQRQHQLAVAFLAPAVEGQEPARGVDGGGVIRAVQIGRW